MLERAETGERRGEGEEKWEGRVELPVGSRRPTKRVRKPFYRIKVDGAGERFRRPSFWGLINPQWSLCSKGRRQSPINIEPDKLLFDRHLRPVVVDKHKEDEEKLKEYGVPFDRSLETGRRRIQLNVSSYAAAIPRAVAG
ncbi:hypothetical protein K0M31_005552 [Melipona bicolor]|uniref:Alpha-carbonic anhydrase domain-containing protein n=1 Tax=Melipona bicolor TaxID=60889 RepID=A0AA40FVV5_9HYME|nr:hypothetical protein K0M31_005552 [Melipona bicolor]